MVAHWAQAGYAWAKSRYCVVPPGRRSGKSEIAKRRIVRAALLSHRSDLKEFYRPYADPRFFIAAPTVQQVKAIYWEDVIAMVPPHLLYGRPNASTLTVRLINGARIQLLGMDRPERAEGRPWDGGVMDEYANMRPEAWSAHMRPALADRGGWCHFVGVPEGRNHYYDMWCYAGEVEIDAKRKGIQPEWTRHHWTSLDVIPLYRGEAGLREIEAARREMDPILFKQEMEGCHLPETRVRLWAGGTKAIADVEIGDVLVSHQCGRLVPTTVLAAGETGVKAIEEVTLANGARIRASKYHKVRVGGKVCRLHNSQTVVFVGLPETLLAGALALTEEVAVVAHKPAGLRQTWNLKVDSPDHSYVMANGLDNFNSFEDFVGRAYYGFTEENKRPLEYKPEHPLILTLDFNVEPCIGVVLQEQVVDNEWTTCVISEIYIPKGGNVLMVCDKFLADYPSHTGFVMLHGDATGGSRGAAKLQGSEWELVRRKLKTALQPGQLLNKMPRTNPRERDRVAALNSRCTNVNGAHHLYVDPSRAPMLTKDLEGVCFVQGGSGELDKSNPKISHLCFHGDTLVETARGIMPMRELPESGMVRGPVGDLVPYARAGLTIPNAEMVEVVVCGEKIRCTPWHKWLTTDGWCCADQLAGKTLVRSHSLMEHKHLVEKSTAGRDATLHVASTDCIGLCGRPITGQFHAERPSTTWTMIRATISRTIWRWLRRLCTNPIMLGAQLLRRCKSEPMAYGVGIAPLATGMRPKLGANGTVNTRGRLKTCATINQRACNAEASSALISATRNSAPTNAEVPSTGPPDAMTKTEPAPCVALSSRPTDGATYRAALEPAAKNCAGDVVLSVRRVPRADAYCLWVSREGCFALKSGWVVKNSDALSYYVARLFPVKKTYKITPGRRK